MEGVERKLRRRLTNRLRRQSTHHLTRMNHRLHVAEADITHQLDEQAVRQAVNQNRLLGCEIIPQQRVEQLVRGELCDECPDQRHHLHGSQICLGGIGIRIRSQQTAQIDRSKHLIILAVAEH